MLPIERHDVVERILADIANGACQYGVNEGHEQKKGMTMNRPDQSIGGAMLVAFFIVALQGCALEPIIRPATARGPITVSFKPAAGTSASAQIGDPMFATFNVMNVPFLRIESPIRHIGNTREGTRTALDIPAGTYLHASDDERGGRYFSSGGNIQVASEAKGAFGKPESLRGGIFLSSSGGWSVFWFWPNHVSATTVPASELGLTLLTMERTPIKSGFRRELIYSGISQSTLSLVYREYIDDMARPAFSQDLKYDFAKGSVIGYKGARFEIQNADNTSITYRVLATLPSQE